MRTGFNVRSATKQSSSSRLSSPFYCLCVSLSPLTCLSSRRSREQGAALVHTASGCCKYDMWLVSTTSSLIALIVRLGKDPITSFRCTTSISCHLGAAVTHSRLLGASRLAPQCLVLWHVQPYIKVSCLPCIPVPQNKLLLILPLSISLEIVT